MATENPSDAKTVERDVASIELPAPAGWKKKLTPKKGASAGRKDIVFIAPDGEEIKSKSQLRGYLKSHPSDVAFKEFDWSTSDTDTPRRSSRLSGKSKASESLENETPQKRKRKLGSNEEAKKEKDDEGATFESAKVGIEDAQGEHDEKEDADDPAKGVVVAVEEEKVAEAGQVSATEENKAATEVKEKEAAVVEEEKEQEEVVGEEEKEQEEEVVGEAEKEQEEEVVGEADKEQEEEVVGEEEKEQEVVGEEEKEEDVVKEEEAGDMDAVVVLGTAKGINEATEEEESNEIKKEGNQVSGSGSSSKQPNVVEEKGAEDNSLPLSQVSEEAKQQGSEYWSADALGGNVPGEGPSYFMPDEFLDVGDALPEPEEEEELGEGQIETTTPAEEDKDTVMQEAKREEK